MIGKGLIAAGVVAVLTATYIGWKFTARGAYESADYRVHDRDGSFEVREYPDLIVATTDARVGSQGRDGSFMRLFRYISGGNEREEKIAMTTPVFMAPKTSNSQSAMGFVMPRDLDEQRVPQPSDSSVEIRKRSGGEFAVIRFSGRPDEDALIQAEERLREWMEKRGLVGENNAESAGYDPPWTPGPLRRNEVLIRLR